MTVLDLKGLDISFVFKTLMQNLILSSIDSNKLKVQDSLGVKAQSIIDELANKLPDLTPVQFHYMLNKYGFDDAIAVLLPDLKLEDLDKYAMYKAYLEQARFYEFSKTLEMFNDIKDKFTVIDENLNFNVEQLKLMWQEASQI